MNAAPAHKDISVVFLGSGPVAAASLRLLAANFTIEAVITKPRPAHHKGAVPVLDLCADSDEYGRVITVTNKAELSEAVHAAGFTSRVGIVIDFGIIITRDVIDSFELGILNSHFSLLPQWRGADPITFSILSGQERTGVSLMSITAGLDEGPILAVGTYDFDGTETTPTLTATLIAISDGLLNSELPKYTAVGGGASLVVTQEFVAENLGYSPEPTFSRKLTKADGILDFTKPAAVLEREVRAYAGWPASRTAIAGRDVVITAAHVLTDAPVGEPGELWREGKQFGFYCGSNADDGGAGVLVVDTIKPAGKGEMSAESFINGYLGK